jgi:SAM-dependent methyltransferase
MRRPIAIVPRMVVQPGPIGQLELVEAMAGATRVLDAGCGSGRLTVALAQAGAAVTGVDSNPEQLARARARASDAAVELELLEADFNAQLPFADAAFDGVASRLALMAASEPVATLRELVRVLAPDGRLASALWAAPAENPWFAIPREAVGAVLGVERASFARAFGRLGDPDEAVDVHRAAGLRDVEARVVVAPVEVSSAAEQWESLVRDNGHFRRIAASATGDQLAAIVQELELRLAGYRQGERLRLARTLVLVTGRR